jgi:hypothetical protein
MSRALIASFFIVEEAAVVRFREVPHRHSAMRCLLLSLLFFASVAAATQQARDSDDSEWGIFVALRRAESAADASFEQCNCCRDVQDLRSRVSALEHQIAQSSKHVLRTSFASRCPSPPVTSAAHAAADVAAPALTRMTASYCSEWVRLPRPRQFRSPLQPNPSSRPCTFRKTLTCSSGRSKGRWSVPAPAAN